MSGLPLFALSLLAAVVIAGVAWSVTLLITVIFGAIWSRSRKRQDTDSIPPSL